MYGRIGNAGRMQYQVGDYWNYIDLNIECSQAYSPGDYTAVFKC